VGGKISYGKFTEELGGFMGISSDSPNVNHGGMGSDVGSGEETLTVYVEWMRGVSCIMSG
jgi:hypothetical protein